MKTWKLIARVFGIAYEIAGGLVLGVLAGLFLDNLLKTKALFTIILSLMGILHGFKMMMKLGE